MAKERLTEMKQRAYIIEVDDIGGDAMKDWLKKKTGHRSFPMVFINGVLVGGNSEFQALCRSG